MGLIHQFYPISLSPSHIFLYICWSPTLILITRALVEDTLNKINKYREIPVYPKWLKLNYGKSNRQFHTIMDTGSKEAGDSMSDQSHYLLLIEGKRKYIFFYKDSPVNLLIQDSKIADFNQTTIYHVADMRDDKEYVKYREIINFKKDGRVPTVKVPTVKEAMNSLENYIMESML